MPNPGDWTANPGARGQFLRLAQDTGIFLENRLAELASAFAGEFTQRRGARINAESITYGSDTEESPLRQIDQRVQFYKEFVRDEPTGIQLIMDVPIEAKYRRDVETCAVAYPIRSIGQSYFSFPISTDQSWGPVFVLESPLPTTNYAASLSVKLEKGASPNTCLRKGRILCGISALRFECDQNLWTAGWSRR